ncbi:hypothetical protein [Halobacillus litoralis]|uniref:hypothetical protein n=1 Tax=Halobacillus litoralis TaxID=45668 RepID=UPI001CFE4402|nr:hypothetical protein [Halobacillus litoralis]
MDTKFDGEDCLRTRQSLFLTEEIQSRTVFSRLISERYRPAYVSVLSYPEIGR